MERIKNLDDVKPGDKFFIYRQYSQNLDVVECSHATPTRCTIGGRQYTKKDACGYGGGNYYSIPHLYPYCDEGKKLYAEQLKRKKAMEAIGKIAQRGNNTSALLFELMEVIERHEKPA